MNAYELGRHHGVSVGKSLNPFIEFSDKWGLYNMGYNSVVWMRSLVNPR